MAPLELREFIFSQLHEKRYAAHLGMDRTIAVVKHRFYWPNMTNDIAQWCRQCQRCARTKPGAGLGKSEIEQFRAYRPMSAVDILGPLNQTYNSNSYIIVAGCYFNKWKESFAVPNHTAGIVADKVVQEVFLRFGFPAQIHTDQGPEFESHLFQKVCKLLGIEKTRSCAYNPKSDGMIERYNRSLLKMLTMFVDHNQRDWDDHLPYVMAAYRASPHKSSGISSNRLMLNREVDCPIDIMVGLPPGIPTQVCPIEYVEWLNMQC